VDDNKKTSKTLEKYRYVGIDAVCDSWNESFIIREGERMTKTRRSLGTPGHRGGKGGQIALQEEEGYREIRPEERVKKKGMLWGGLQSYLRCQSWGSIS